MLYLKPGERVMQSNRESASVMLKRWKFKSRKLQRSMVCVTALVSFAAGSLLTAQLANVEHASADNNRVFELMIYHTMPGKEPALESIFQDVSKLQTKHGLNVIGYWVPNEDPGWQDTFIYLVAHPSRGEATKNWHTLHTDPEFPPYRKAAEPLIQKADGQFKVDEIYMRPANFSAMK
jgi:NIPSNAP